MAFVVRRRGSTLTEASIISYLAQQVDMFTELIDFQDHIYIFHTWYLVMKKEIEPFVSGFGRFLPTRRHGRYFLRIQYPGLLPGRSFEGNSGTP